jgi:type II secretory pathway pseudopilin PulG
MSARPRAQLGLSVVEILLTTAILGLLAALAVPAVGQPHQAGKVAQLVSGVSVLRTAIDSYWSQHDEFPGAQGAEQFVAQLTRSTNRAGRVGEGLGFAYGPYLRRGVLPSNPFDGGNLLRVASPLPTVPAGQAAWVYDPATGEVAADTPGETPDGVRYFEL